KNNLNQNSDSYNNYFSSGYQKLICNEYFSSLPDGSTERNFLKIIEFLGERCHLNNKDYTDQDEYKILKIFLSQLNNKQILELSTSFENFISLEQDN
ncbi:hypothetical protein, partial [Acinetobacter lactucae]|uniref:hypothetical protein n=1 Tax=Acinetobacter lactucae TaxID=1785128 RepID=UPI000AB62AA7